MSAVAKNLASFAEEIAVGSVNELSEAEIDQVSGGMMMMEWMDLNQA